MNYIESDREAASGSMWVQFYSGSIVNEFQSQQQKREISEPRDFVRIVSPGNTLSIVDTVANDEHKRKYARQWAEYQNRGGAGEAIAGTRIESWSRLSKAQVDELRAIKFYTVEAIAGASDAQLQGIGMICGQSAYTFRDDAARFLKVAEADSKLSEADEKLKRANEELAQKTADFNAKMALMEARMDALAEAATSQAEKRSPGRPKQAEA